MSKRETPLDYEIDLAVRVTFDTLCDRGFDAKVVRVALDAYEGDLWWEIYGPAVDKAGNAIGIGADPDDRLAR